VCRQGAIFAKAGRLILFIIQGTAIQRIISIKSLFLAQLSSLESLQTKYGIQTIPPQVRLNEIQPMWKKRYFIASNFPWAVA
jgi:hypothetical protein